MSDLHTGTPHVDAAKVARLVAQINRAGPDLVVLLGDYVDPTVPFGTPVAPEAVAAALGGLRAPRGVVAVLGNHDWVHTGTDMARHLRAAGVTVLDNDAVAVGERLWVAGVGPEGDRVANPVAALAGVPAGVAVLLLSHHPDAFVRVPGRVALTLAGHTHGGQVALPGLGARHIPSRFGHRFAGGHVVEDGRHLFVSVGVGTSRFPIRVLTPPEIVLLRLQPRRRPSGGRALRVRGASRRIPARRAPGEPGRPDEFDGAPDRH
jgi:predicted MPP superfamily phosphohydrolase